MQTLSELLATFPDPPKTLLNNEGNTSSFSRVGVISHISHASHSSHSSVSSSGSTSPVGSGVIMSGSLDMSMGIGLNRSTAPSANLSFTAGGGSAVASGYQEADLLLLERSCREELDAATRKQVFDKLMSEPVLIVERALDLAYTNARNSLMKELATAKKKKIEKLEKDCPCCSSVFTNKHFMDFGNHLVPKQEVVDTLDLTNNTANKIKFRVMVPLQETPMETDTFSLLVSPIEGIIKKKDVAHLQFKLIAKQPGKVAIIVLIVVEGGLKFHALVKQEIIEG